MIPMLARVDARFRVLLAWTILCCAALLVMVPVAVSAVGLVDAWQRAHALRTDVAALSQRVYGHLLQTPTSREMPLGDDSAELVGEVAFSGALGDVLRAFVALEQTDIKLSGLTIEALPGEPAGRVRGRAELRHVYLMVSADES